MRQFSLGLLVSLLSFNLLMNEAISSSPYYPQPTFLRDFVAGDAYSYSYCLETGEYGIQQGTKEQAGIVVQSCQVSNVLCYNLENSNTVNYQFNGINYVSLYDLGHTNDIAKAYNLQSSPYGTVYNSIAVTNIDGGSANYPISPTFVISSNAQPNTFQPMQQTVATNLAASTQFSTTQNVTVGHIYLLRVTATSAADWNTPTLLLAKWMPISSHYTGLSNAGILQNQLVGHKVRWSILFDASHNPPSPSPSPSPFPSPSNDNSDASNNAITAVILGTVALLGSVAAVCTTIAIFYWNKNKRQPFEQQERIIQNYQTHL